MVVAEPEADIEFKVQPSQSLRRSANFTRRCTELKNVHKIHTASRDAHHATTFAHAAPQRACALAAARSRAVAEGRPAWALAAARLRAVAEGHQGHGAAGTPRPHAGRHAFWRTATGATLSVGVSKWWLGRVLACFARRARLKLVFWDFSTVNGSASKF